MQTLRSYLDPLALTLNAYLRVRHASHTEDQSAHAENQSPKTQDLTPEMEFTYRVRDPLGVIHDGKLESANAETAGQQLRRDGFLVLNLDEADVGDLFPRRVTKNDIIYVTNQLAIMVDTGISLSVALAGIVEQESNSTLKKVLGDLKNSVEGGQDFSEPFWPGIQNISTRPMSRSSRPAKRPAR